MLFPFLFKRCAAPLILIIAFGIYCVAAGESPSALHTLLELSGSLGQQWALGDLDGDGETDILVSRQVGQTGGGYLYRVALKLSDSVSDSEGCSFTFENAD